MENPIFLWMINIGGTPMAGNLHITYITSFSKKATAATAAVEERIHPYRRLDLGEVPFAMASFATRLGMRAQSYCHGDLGQLSHGSWGKKKLEHLHVSGEYQGNNGI